MRSIDWDHWVEQSVRAEVLLQRKTTSDLGKTLLGLSLES